MSKPDDVRELPLSNDPSRFALVDSRDYPRASHHSWQILNDHVVSIFKAKTGKLRFVYLARLVMRAPRGLLVDHIDGNPLRCTRDNLRYAIVAQNNRNRAKSGAPRGRVRSSSYKGVTLDERRGHYHASITVDGKAVNLGVFAHEEDAARAYDRAARKWHRQFARVNFPSERSK